MYRYFDIVEAIKNGQKQVTDLQGFSAREIADAVNELIREAVQRERRECAIVAEDAGEPGGGLGRRARR